MGCFSATISDGVQTLCVASKAITSRMKALMMAPGVGFDVAPQCSHLNSSALMRIDLGDVGSVDDIVLLLVIRHVPAGARQTIGRTHLQAMCSG